jgi:hypothetical protein
VNDSIGRINIDKIYKENNVIKNISNILDYKLKSHKLIIKKYKNDDCLLVISDLPNTKTIETNININQCILSNINSIFLSELDIHSTKYKYKYYTQSYFKKIFKPNTSTNLVNKIITTGKDFSWVIVSKDIYKTIKTSTHYVNNSNETQSFTIFNAGKIDNINVYVSDDINESTIYFGNYDSFTIIINNNVKEEYVKCNNTQKEEKIICLDYIFIKNGDIKCLNII